MSKTAAVMHWREDWEYCTEYEKGDVVRRGGLLWLCLQQNAGHDPRDEFNRNYWFPFGEGDGDGTMNHEELLNRLGKGDDEAAWHLAAWQHKILVQVALIPDDGNTYGIKFNAQTNSFMWVPVSGGGGGTGNHEELENRLGYDPVTGQAWHLTPLQHQFLTGGGFYRGPFADKAAIEAAYPTDVDGAYAANRETKTFWLWSVASSEWVNSGQGAPVEGVSDHNMLSNLLGGDATNKKYFHVSEEGWEKVEQWVNQTPDKPINLAPYDGEIDMDERPLFESTPYFHPYNHEMYMYQIQIIDSEGNVFFDSGAEVMSTVTYRLAAGILNVNSTYSWRVRYCGSNVKWSLWSNPTFFQTAATFPAVTITPPSLILPGDKTIVNTMTPTLLTTPFDSASGLTQGEGDFQISERADFSTIVDAGTGENIYTSQTELSRGIEYFGRANHKNDDGTVSSRWSRIVSFVVREYYRKKRIGFAMSDNYVLTRIDDNLNPVEMDAEYWLWNPIYAGLQASRAQTYTPLESDTREYAMSTLPAFFIRNGVVPSGPLAGQRFWLWDTNEPSSSDYADGFHLHGAFKSNNYGDQTSILVSREFATRTSSDNTVTGINLLEYAYVASNAYAPTPAILRSWLSSYMNTDSATPAKRGWAYGTYMHNCALQLLGLLYAGSFSAYSNMFRVRDTAGSGSLFGVYLAPLVSTGAYYLRIAGLGNQTALMPGQADNDTPVATYRTLVPASWTVNASAPTGAGINYILADSDGPPDMHLGDYVIGANIDDGSEWDENVTAGSISCVNRANPDSHGGQANTELKYAGLFKQVGFVADVTNRLNRIIKYV